jgi:hypothetical protein
MGKMVTVDPRAFALFKLWIAQDSDPLKKRRDANQAMVLVHLVEDLPHLSSEDIKVFPTVIRGMLQSNAPLLLNLKMAKKAKRFAWPFSPWHMRLVERCCGGVGDGRATAHPPSAFRR